MELIFNTPENWQDLQEKVSQLLNNVGFKAETNYPFKTPRGEVNLDIYAIDPFSIDQISYVAECKNWGSAIPQTIVHAFNTVMHETGANIGYIIAKKGFQRGAYDYTTNTNIKVMTFEELQQRYFPRWFQEYFRKEIFVFTEQFSGYIEPFNSRRERYVDTLSPGGQQSFVALKAKYEVFDYFLTSLSVPDVSFSLHKEATTDFEGIKFEVLKQGLEKSARKTFNATCFFDLLNELREEVTSITKQFDAFFGKNIFLDKDG